MSQPWQERETGWQRRVFWRRRHVLEFTGWNKYVLANLIRCGDVGEIFLKGDKNAWFSSDAIKEYCREKVKAVPRS